LLDEDKKRNEKIVGTVIELDLEVTNKKDSDR